MISATKQCYQKWQPVFTSFRPCSLWNLEFQQEKDQLFRRQPKTKSVSTYVEFFYKSFQNVFRSSQKGTLHFFLSQQPPSSVFPKLIAWINISWVVSFCGVLMVATQKLSSPMRCVVSFFPISFFIGTPIPIISVTRSFLTLFLREIPRDFLISISTSSNLDVFARYSRLVYHCLMDTLFAWNIPDSSSISLQSIPLLQKQPPKYRQFSHRSIS